MKKTFLLLSSILILFACSDNRQIVTYEPLFYEPLPFDGMKGNVSTVVAESWSYSAIRRNENKRSLSVVNVTNYTDDGKIGETGMKMFASEEDSTTMKTINSYENDRLTVQDVYFRTSKFDSSNVRLRYEAESSNKALIYWDTENVQDTNRVSVEYDFEKQIKTETPIMSSGENTECTTTYYQNHLPIKIVSETRYFTTSIIFEYDDDNNLIRKQKTTISKEEGEENYVDETRYQYTKIDKQNNWLYRSVIFNGDSNKPNVEIREITYRK